MSFGAGIAEEAIERAEHVATVLRMRKATIIGLVVWPAFEGEDMYQVMLAHTRDKVPPLGQRMEAAIPDGLEQVVMRCLAKDPRERTPSAKALADQLQPFT